MKPYASLLLLAAFSLCILSCGFSGNSDKPRGPAIGGSVPPIVAIYQMEVVNNTDGAVSVFLSAFYYKLGDDADYYLIVYNEFCTVAGNTIGTAEFYWAPRRGLGGYSDTLDPSSPAWCPSVEEMKAQFRPGINSFLLGIRIDGEESYLAGWPQSLELPSLLYDYDRHDIVLDTGKIVRYGIGYGDNKEVRVMRYGEDDLVYVPFIISYDHDGQTEEHDFDFVNVVYGKVLLVIDAPDAITFQTLALSLSPDDL